MCSFRFETFLEESIVNSAKLGDLDKIKQCLKFQIFDVNVCDYDGLTSLYWAAIENKIEIVNLLLKHPEIDVNTRVSAFSIT